MSVAMTKGQNLTSQLQSTFRCIFSRLHGLVTVRHDLSALSLWVSRHHCGESRPRGRDVVLTDDDYANAGHLGGAVTRA
jgi:hypothetical protein